LSYHLLRQPPILLRYGSGTQSHIGAAAAKATPTAEAAIVVVSAFVA